MSRCAVKVFSKDVVNGYRKWGEYRRVGRGVSMLPGTPILARKGPG